MKIPIALVVMLSALSANAQSVYRCGNEYSQAPCPLARVVEASDERSEAQRAEARRIAADERLQGAQMERERLAMLSAQKPGGAISLSGMPQKTTKSHRPNKPKWAKFKKPKKSQRQA